MYYADNLTTMGEIKIGIVREGRIPMDKRVPLLPEQCVKLVTQYKNVSIFVQPSPDRCIKDLEYSQAGIAVQEDLSFCDIIFGVKEVPIPLLMPDKTYFFFSHTMKKQPHNKLLLQTILEKKITLIDYECLTDANGNRIIAFGKYAGIVGTYNALITYGRKYNLYDLKPAYKCHDLREVTRELTKVRLGNVKILLTGGGRVGNGAIEILNLLKIKRVSTDEFLNNTFDTPVYCQLRSQDYHKHKAGNLWNAEEFYTHPEKYYSTFYKYTKEADILIAGAYWDPKAPALFTKEDMRREDFKIRVIADITCDMEGSIPCTKRPSSIGNPVYDYNPFTEDLELPFTNSQNVSVMAIDNLPGELPRDASRDFGKQLIENVLPNLLMNDSNYVIERATITKYGRLHGRYKYLEDYIKA